jgi:hypothetical protein
MGTTLRCVVQGTSFGGEDSNSHPASSEEMSLPAFEGTLLSMCAHQLQDLCPQSSHFTPWTLEILLAQAQHMYQLTPFSFVYLTGMGLGASTCKCFCCIGKKVMCEFIGKPLMRDAGVRMLVACTKAH